MEERNAERIARKQMIQELKQKKELEIIVTIISLIKKEKNKQIQLAKELKEQEEKKRLSEERHRLELEVIQVQSIYS